MQHRSTPIAGASALALTLFCATPAVLAHDSDTDGHIPANVNYGLFEQMEALDRLKQLESISRPNN